MRPTDYRNLAAAAAASAAIAWLVMSLVFTTLPPLPWTAVPTMALIALGEVLLGRSLRARLRGDRPWPPWKPTEVTRLVALAKASSAAGAIIGGLALGALIYVLPSVANPVPRSDALAASGTLVAAALQLAAGLYLENSCRSPKPPRDDDEASDGSASRRTTR